MSGIESIQFAPGRDSFERTNDAARGLSLGDFSKSDFDNFRTNSELSNDSKNNISEQFGDLTITNGGDESQDSKPANNDELVNRQVRPGEFAPDVSPPDNLDQPDAGAPDIGSLPDEPGLGDDGAPEGPDILEDPGLPDEVTPEDSDILEDPGLGDDGAPGITKLPEEPGPIGDNQLESE